MGRNGHVYIVHLLLQYSADPLLTDAQGFNVLHLATHSSNIMLILYLLHQPNITPDLLDAQEHTSIMWAAYQGDALSVDVFLRWGADVKRRDNMGLTALHWAVVRGISSSPLLGTLVSCSSLVFCYWRLMAGNKMCMRRLIEEGADIAALTNEGKSPVKLAEEMKCSLVFARALQDSGRYNDDLTPRVKPRFSQELADKIVFCSPFVPPQSPFLAFFVFVRRADSSSRFGLRWCCSRRYHFTCRHGSSRSGSTAQTSWSRISSSKIYPAPQDKSTKPHI
jgi:palmitoyltransferase